MCSSFPVQNPDFYSRWRRIIWRSNLESVLFLLFDKCKTFSNLFVLPLWLNTLTICCIRGTIRHFVLKCELLFCWSSSQIFCWHLPSIPHQIKKKSAFIQTLSECADSSLYRVLGLQFGFKCIICLGKCLLWGTTCPCCDAVFMSVIGPHFVPACVCVCDGLT